MAIVRCFICVAAAVHRPPLPSRAQLFVPPPSAPGGGGGTVVRFVRSAAGAHACTPSCPGSLPPCCAGTTEVQEPPPLPTQKALQKE